MRKNFNGNEGEAAREVTFPFSFSPLTVSARSQPPKILISPQKFHFFQVYELVDDLIGRIHMGIEGAPPEMRMPPEDTRFVKSPRGRRFLPAG